MFTESRKQTIKLVVAISIICLILITVGILMIKYQTYINTARKNPSIKNIN